MLDRRDIYSLAQTPFNATSCSDPVEADLNTVNIDNLFPDSINAKLSYTDYCAITQDMATMHINEESLSIMEGMGFPRKYVKEGLNRVELNHATATYHLLVMN